MINFLRNRSLQGRTSKTATSPQSPPKSSAPQPSAAVPEPLPALVPEASEVQEEELPSIDAEAIAAVDDSEKSGPVADALANVDEPPAQRYEARQNPDGWVVYDRVTADTAEVYGYRLVKMNRSRADSLVEVLNRGEARRRGRNG